MRQILQNLKDGSTEVADVPVPQVAHGSLLIRTSRTLVSAGTERMLVDFGKGNLLQKARQQPDKVKQVLEKVKTDGLMATINTVLNKLDTPLPLGYCNVGRAIEVGNSVTGFSVGDRVVSNGKHAEFVSVPQNLCAKIPDSVDDESAAFTVIGAIALQGIRLLQPTLGETVVVTGLGLIGLVAVQLLRAHGCRVLGLDFDASKLALAREFGAETVNLAAGEDPVAKAQIYSRRRGVDAVLITASTKSNEPIHQAAMMCRKRGRIVLVGVVGMEMSRADFYEKELSFQVSCSYGPGRYDPEYEERGHDYPVGFVRWTEQRNFEAILDMLADGRLDFKPLVSHRFLIDAADQAYALISNGNPLGVLLEYASDESAPLQRCVAITQSTATTAHSSKTASKAPALGFIGAGNYATAVLIPAFARTNARLVSVASASGVSGVHVAKKFGIEQAATDSDALINDAAINTIIITTRHDSHADWVCKALQAGKHVFVEKPLALSCEQLEQVATAHMANPQQLLMVGFNRRYAPHVVAAKRALQAKPGPKSFIMTVNAGAIPREHWTQNMGIGGGRIIGEGCHFIDLLRFLAATPIVSTRAIGMGSTAPHDTVVISLQFADGSIGTVNYFANGSKEFPKERLEIFAQGSILQLDNFRSLRSFNWPGVSNQRSWRQDKGQQQCAKAFVDAIASGDTSQLISFDELREVMLACFDAVDQLA
jgi:predicted dehydrogenase/threonine dehydrogenase-like Zn-dependent dehydrogenase